MIDPLETGSLPYDWVLAIVWIVWMSYLCEFEFVATFVDIGIF